MTNTKSRKPAVADVNKDNAKKNIVCKKNLLDAWAKNGIPLVLDDLSSPRSAIGQLEYFPRTIRQFNFWDGTANSHSVRNGFPTISRNANDTLRRYPELRKEIEDILDALIAREILQHNRAKPIRLKKLRDSNTLEKKLRTILENELANLRKQQSEERKIHNDKVVGLDGQVKELKKLVRELKVENEELNLQIGTLNSQLLKISPLRKV